MSYRVPESDVAGYYREGYIVFRGLLPTSLVADLRRECDKAAVIARKHRGDQAQRLQPISAYADQIDQKPFRDYEELPALREALSQVLSPRHYVGGPDIMGVLIEPADGPYCTAWHRDITLKTSRMPEDQFRDLILDWNSANQINCPLYDDDCTWFVPGSHLRVRDMPGEAALATLPPEIDRVNSTVTDPVEKELLCLRYTMSMPGAVQFRLHPGDLALYRPYAWHIGNYVPYKKRATLHDAVFTPEYEQWWKAWIAGGSPRWERKPAPVG